MQSMHGLARAYVKTAEFIKAYLTGCTYTGLVGPYARFALRRAPREYSRILLQICTGIFRGKCLRQMPDVSCWNEYFELVTVAPANNKYSDIFRDSGGFFFFFILGQRF